VQMQNFQRIEEGLDRLAKLKTDSPEAMYDLAAIKGVLGKSTESLAALKKSVELSDARLKKDPKAHNMRTEITKDERFKIISQMPEFKSLAAQP